MLDLSVAVVDDALVEPLVLLLEPLHAQDGRVGVGVRPGLEAPSLHGEVLEALEPHDLWRRVAKDLQVHEDVLLL